MSGWTKFRDAITHKVLPIAAAALPFIPGVGTAISSGISAIGGLFGGGNPSGSSPGVSQGDPNWSSATPYEPQVDQLPQVSVSAPSRPIDWGQAIGTVGTGLAGFLGQRQTNQANAQMAQKQMDFQAAQTGTSYQRGVADMKAAGLNPMLAYSQGGAQSGGGSTAVMGNAVGAGVSSAIQGAQTMASIQNLQSQTEATNAQANLTDAQAVSEATRPALLRAQASQSVSSARQAEAAASQADAARNQILQEIAQRNRTNPLSARMAAAQATSAETDAQLRALGLPAARNEAAFEESSIGRNIRSSDAVTGTIGRVLNSAKSYRSLSPGYGP